jgi:hypothetical protein
MLSENSDSQEDWERLGLELVAEGEGEGEVTLDYIRENRQQIKETLASVVTSNYLEGRERNDSCIGEPEDFGANKQESICADDSVSQVLRNGRPQRRIISTSESSTSFGPLSPEEDAIRILLMNYPVQRREDGGSICTPCFGGYPLKSGFYIGLLTL